MLAEISADVLLELKQKALQIMADKNAYCSVDDVVRMMLHELNANPLLAAVMVERHFAAGSREQ